MLPLTATLFAPAKLTLSLRITGVRDDGMHLIDAEMVTLDFGDTLQVRAGSGVSYRGVWTGEGDGTDLVSRALELLGEVRRVEVDKAIPPGAGLGGGSSDAAAILAAGEWKDLDRAARLGADIAFCLAGGRAQVQGIGEQITHLPFVEQTITLVTPPLHCSTPAVYRAWDAMGAPVGVNGNDLEAAALQVQPALAHWRDRLHEHTGKTPRLAGSGSTWFVEGSFPGENMVVTRTTPRRTSADD